MARSRPRRSSGNILGLKPGSRAWSGRRWTGRFGSLRVPSPSGAQGGFLPGRLRGPHRHRRRPGRALGGCRGGCPPAGLGLRSVFTPSGRAAGRIEGFEEVDPRKAAEPVSVTCLFCVLKGLSRSPRLVLDPPAWGAPGLLTAADLGALVLPDGCLGLPTLAALEQGIPVVAVHDPGQRMANDLSALPWAPGQFLRVSNYLEAAGALLALRAGVSTESVRRPLAPTSFSRSPIPGA